MEQSLTKKKIKLEIPKYTLGEELFSAISHGVGSCLSIAALVLLIVRAAIYGSAISVVATSIYGATLVILYTMSTLYHSFSPRITAKKVFRIFDHCSIFLLIAGTYTVYSLLVLKGALGWTIFGIVWGAAILGIVLNAINLEKYKKFSMVCYIAMGWIIIFSFKTLIASLAKGGVVFLLIGGVCYTVGAIIYGLGKKIKYMHSIWHLFVLAGSICHFFSILLYAI
ncbi:MAG: hemolysin III family protein [Clostridia bacterium]|nr:hemolysin III family protein [Clostridia bacterium]